MANTNFDLTTLDFETIKSNFKTFLKRSDSPFKDYDYDGSNINTLLDILSYNTYLNSYYLNMVGSEMFLDTAQLRDSVVSHSKELNYIPRSFRSASANISFTVTPDSGSITSLLLPKGTTFTSVLGSNSFTFSTNENYTYTVNSDGNFNIENLQIFEGEYVTDTFVYDASNTAQRFVLSNPTVDTLSLTVTALENNGANTLAYTRASSLLDVQSTTRAYFLQAAENYQYEILFGDGVIGRPPVSGSVISVEYRISNGPLPNGARNFDIDGPIQGQANVSSITTISAAAGGDVHESIESIKFNAPRHYQNQDRAITASDYENLILANFNEVSTVSVYGGEDAIPPQYGKVVISVDARNADGASELLKSRILSFIRTRSPLSIEPIFVDPEFLFIKVDSLVRFNGSVTTLTPNDIQTLVTSRISNFNTNNLSNYNKTLRYSRLVNDIDLTNASIISNDTTLTPYKVITPNLNVNNSITLKYNFQINASPRTGYPHSAGDTHSVFSTRFVYDNTTCILEDDGNGNIVVVSVFSSTHQRLATIGTVDYTTGVVQIDNFNISRYEGSGIKVFVDSYYNDISSTQNVIIEIKDEDIFVTSQELRA